MSIHAADRARALELAHTGQHEDWHAVCRKMVFEGYGIEIFNETAFTEEIDLICHRERGLKAAIDPNPDARLYDSGN
jgi:hypothetical protein